MSIQKEVVNEVSAESALEYAAAISPNRKKAEVIIPISGSIAIVGNKSSLVALIPFCVAY